jgi:osmotically-inducible protein OsmY
MTRETKIPAGSGSDDERIHEYLTERLVRASHFPGLIDVVFEVHGGKVTLSGTVPHRGLKQSIEETAAACPGVRQVENNLDVALTAPWPDALALKPTDQG